MLGCPLLLCCFFPISCCPSVRLPRSHLASLPCTSSWAFLAHSLLMDGCCFVFLSRGWGLVPRVPMGRLHGGIRVHQIEGAACTVTCYPLPPSLIISYHLSPSLTASYRLLTSLTVSYHLFATSSGSRIVLDDFALLHGEDNSRRCGRFACVVEDRDERASEEGGAGGGSEGKH